MNTSSSSPMVISGPGLLGSLERDDGLDGAVHHHADQGAEHVSHATAEQGAADDHRGDDVELGADAVAGVAGTRVGGEDQAAQAAATPLTTYTRTLVRATSRPISRADCSSPPMAYTVRPKRV